VDPSGPQKQPLFDHERMASLLSQELETYLEAHDLPIEDLEFSEDGRTIEFTANDVQFEYHLDTGELTNLGEEEEEEEEREWRNFAPDSTAYVYAEDHNLYFVEIVDGVEQDAVQLTTDGEEDYSFGSREVDEDEEEEVDETDYRVSSGANWSEDSQAFYITRTDRRHVGKLYLVDDAGRAPAGARGVPVRHAGRGGRAPVGALRVRPRPSMELRRAGRGPVQGPAALHIHWTNGGSDNLRMVRRARSRRYLELIDVDMATDEGDGAGHRGHEWGRILTRAPATWARTTRVTSSGTPGGRAGPTTTATTTTGTSCNPVTTGTWNARNIQEVDEDTGRIWFTAVGREEGENVNYQHLYRVDADGSNLTLLDPGTPTTTRASRRTSGRAEQLLPDRSAAALGAP
jgi:dipeptidyl-peptidase 4